MSIQLTFSPSAGSTLVGVNQPIEIISNRTLDLSNLEGCIHVYGPDFTVAQNTTMANSVAYDKQHLSKVLRSGGFQGEVEIQILVEGSTVLPESPDTETGTRIMVYPKGSWAEHTDYTVFISGGDNSEKESTLRSISIYEPTALQVSRGQLIFEGTYTEDESDVLVIQVTSGGRANEVEFSWSFLDGESGQVESSSKLKDEVVHYLDNGISIRILTAEDQLIVDGDFSSAYLQKPELLESTLKYQFSTAKKEMIEVEAESSTSPLMTTLLVNGFELINSSPKDEASNVPLNKTNIVLQFSKDVNPQSVNAKTIKIKATAADGTSETVEVPASFTVEGSRVFIKLEVE
jgi:hypothetical protein